jgi:Fe-S oxidoreductase
VAYHDSCFYGRYNGIYEEQRALVQMGGGELVELDRNRENSFCCGAGGGNFWREEKEPRVSWNRAAEVMETGAPTLAVSCPFCMAMLEDGLKAQEGFEENPVKVRHVVEIVADAIPDEEPVAVGAGAEDEEGEAAPA